MRGHGRVAGELEPILVAKPASQTGAFQRLPTRRRDSGPLIQEVPVDRLRQHMVLADTIEPRFHRIEKELAARLRCPSTVCSRANASCGTDLRVGRPLPVWSSDFRRREGRTG